ncbi:endospore germination permease [Paenibacillus sp. PR3]|uniref:Endospore germination permease n=1 Tax=Paenibacillus terricola TaxID=2763503 RepID=A0ABR8N1C5_9BACL|nr:endospore germination permease [Paenibacillus terricola]MBD3921980.1 endospore germination permease [Paenibacillus terricola]
METGYSKLQLLFLLLLSLGISNHVLIIPYLLQQAGRDAWVSAIIAFILLLIWGLILYSICRSIRLQTFNDWLKQRTGRFVSGIIIGAFFTYFLISALMIVFDATKSIKIYFLPRTPYFVIVITFAAICYSAAKSGLRAIIYMSAILLPIVWLLGTGVSVATSPSKEYSMLFPIFSNGFGPVLHGAGIVFGGCMDLMVILLLQYKMKKPLNIPFIFVSVFLLVGLILGPVTGEIAAFGPNVASNMRFPAFEQWRLVMIGPEISHVDFLAVFQMMVGGVIRNALCLYLLAELIQWRPAAFPRAVMAAVSVLFCLIPIFKISDIWFQSFVQRYFYMFSIVFGIAMTCLLLIISNLSPKKEGGTA